MKNNSFLFGIILVSILLIGGGVLAVIKLGSGAKVEINKMVKLVSTDRAYDWGEIKMSDGVAKAQFEIRNEGTDTLKLFNVVTSCSCTTAQLKQDESNSPLFDMHTKSNYVMEIAPGKSAILEAVFDPNFHGPSGVGSITRQVTVETNDPSQTQLQFSLSANVVK